MKQQESRKPARRRLRHQCPPAICLALGMTLGAVRTAPADEAAVAGASAADTGQLHEVIVYARRRAEPVEETPLAVSVRSGEELREASALLLDDLGRDVPNVHMYASPQSVSALDVTIRGQTVNRSAIVFDPAVGLYVDGVCVAAASPAPTSSAT